MFRAEPAIASTLASDIWPASSTNSVSIAPTKSDRAHIQLVPRRDVDLAGRERARARPRCRRRTPRSPPCSGPPRPPSASRGRRRLLADAASHTSSSRLPITLWLLAVMPTVRPARTSSRIIRAPVNVLPEPGGPWIASVDESSARPSAFEAASRSTSAPSATSGAPTPGRCPRPAARARAAGRSPPGCRPGVVQPVVAHPFAEPHQGAALLDGIERTGRHERRRMRAVPVSAAARRSIVPAAASRAIDPARGLAARVVRFVPDRDLVLLLGVERVPEDIGVPVRVPRRPDQRQPADRIRLVDELLVGHRPQGEVLPPLRLVLAPVPLEQLRQQPACLLVRGPVAAVLRHAVGQRLGERLPPGRPTPRAAGVGSVLPGTGRGTLHAFTLGDVPPPLFQPVAQPQVRAAVVLVVGARSLAGSCRRAASFATDSSHFSYARMLDSASFSSTSRSSR